MKNERQSSSPIKRILRWTGVGIIMGIGVLHPASMVISWLEQQIAPVHSQHGLGQMLSGRLFASFTLQMLPMTGLYATLGGLLGLLFASFNAQIVRSHLQISHLEQELASDISTLMQAGENERVEFKSSARWDLREDKVNKLLSGVIVKTIAALANHEGGSLLIGVSDNGQVLGLEKDYQTLKSPNRDGYMQFLFTLIRDHLGGHVCGLVHIVFAQDRGLDVCRVVVEPSMEPVFVNNGRTASLFVRAGNTTRELDARESVTYAIRRKRRNA